jgi:hypothetical protein
MVPGSGQSHADCLSKGLEHDTLLDIVERLELTTVRSAARRVREGDATLRVIRVSSGAPGTHCRRRGKHGAFVSLRSG